MLCGWLVHRSARSSCGALAGATHSQSLVDETQRPGRRDLEPIHLCSVGAALTARSRLPSLAETGEDAPVEVLETRTRRRRKAPRHRPAPEAITVVLVEFPRS